MFLCVKNNTKYNYIKVIHSVCVCKKQVYTFNLTHKLILDAHSYINKILFMVRNLLKTYNN